MAIDFLEKQLTNVTKCVNINLKVNYFKVINGVRR